MNKKLERQSIKTASSALLAVSGGVDSIVLLSLLHQAMVNPDKLGITKLEKLIRLFTQEVSLKKIKVAYVDHSQREDTHLDIAAIKVICKKFNIPLDVIKLDLPPSCSEQIARKERYQALEKLKAKEGFGHIITAHHADDAIETAIINIIRGTGPRGLSSLSHQRDSIWRPFLYKLEEGIYISKNDILNYADKNNLLWHEDSTNQSNQYLRNRVRQQLSSQSLAKKIKLLNLISSSLKLNKEIADALADLGSSLATDKSKQIYSKKLFKLLPEEVKDQFIHTMLTQNGFDVNKDAVMRAKEFIQTKTTGKTLQLKGCEIRIPEKEEFQFISLLRNSTSKNSKVL